MGGGIKTQLDKILLCIKAKESEGAKVVPLFILLKTYFHVYWGSLDKGQGIRKPSSLTMTQNTGRGQKSILIAEGGSFIAYVIRDNKINKQWKYMYSPLGASL